MGWFVFGDLSVVVPLTVFFLCIWKPIRRWIFPFICVGSAILIQHEIIDFRWSDAGVWGYAVLGALLLFWTISQKEILAPGWLEMYSFLFRLKRSKSFRSELAQWLACMAVASLSLIVFSLYARSSPWIMGVQWGFFVLSMICFLSLIKNLLFPAACIGFALFVIPRISGLPWQAEMRLGYGVLGVLLFLWSNHNYRNSAEFQMKSQKRAFRKNDVDSLIKLLKSRHSKVRKAAAEALGEIGDAQAVEPLIAALQDEDRSMRWRAAEALGEIGGAQAVEPLIAALQDEDRSMRWRAAEALDDVSQRLDEFEPIWESSEPETKAAYWVAKKEWNKCVKIGTPAVKPLIAALKDKDENVRKQAAYALGKIGDAQAVEPLSAALEDNDARVRRGAAEALRKIGDAQAVEPLIAALKDNDARVRKNAAEALGELGGAQAVEPLIAALKDKDANVRWQVAYALGEIGGAQAVEPLIAALKDKVGSVRWRAAEALGEESLIAALEDNDARVRRGAAEALGNLGGAQAVEPLIAALKDKDENVRWRAAEALGNLGGAQAVEPLIAALKDKDENVRWRAAEALDDLSQRLDEFEPIWESNEPETKAAYWVAKKEWDKCVKIGTPAIERLITIVENWPKSGSREVVREAAVSLATLYRYKWRFSEQQKQRLFAMRDTLEASPHKDTSHTDVDWGSIAPDGHHEDRHEDHGSKSPLSVSFPF
jgi:HEAT repeat protein